MIASRRAAAKTELAASRRLRHESRLSAAERRARKALSLLRSAMDWGEDTAEFEPAHIELDAAGRSVRRIFGCHLAYEDGVYYQRCPVALAHGRVGMSPAFQIEESHCSICGADPADCEHIAGESYDGVESVRNITKGKLLHIAYVSRPRNPDARIESISMSVTELQEDLGADWQPGMAVSCDQCLYPCEGVRELELPGGPEAPSSGRGADTKATATIASYGEHGAIEDR